MPVGFLSDEELCEIAMNFLRVHYPEDIIPIPIAEILDMKLSMNIIPTPNLQRDFGIDGILAGDFSGIYVDMFMESERENRYRFTLAHELGHLLIHRKYLEQLGPFESIVQWIACINGMNGKTRNTMETHGNKFASYLLVPRHHLKREFLDKLPEVSDLIEEAKNLGLVRHKYLDFAIDHMADALANIFGVSREVMEICIRKEKLDQDIP